MKSQKESSGLAARLARRVSRTSIQFNLIEPNDRILVAVSGGKDSLCLAWLLQDMKKRLPFSIELLALHVDVTGTGQTCEPLAKWFDQTGMKFETVSENITEVIEKNTKKGGTPCPVCSRMRRGIIYTQAMSRQFNKVALGHHLEDTLATFLMNLFYSGKLQAMPPGYRTDRGTLEVIRPMIEIEENQLERLASEKGFPPIYRDFCQGTKNRKRCELERLIKELSKDNPHIRQVMLGALKNVKPSHLFDRLVVKKM